jgi:hypothetical protein
MWTVQHTAVYTVNVPAAVEQGPSICRRFGIHPFIRPNRIVNEGDKMG